MLALFLLLGKAPAALTITLEEAQELASKNYPKIKAFEEEIEALKRSEEKTERERFGTLSAFSSYETLNRNYTLTPLSNLPTPYSPPPFDSRRARYGLAYTAPLYLGGAIAKRVEMGRLKRTLLSSLKEATQWQLRFNAASLYLSYLALSERERALREQRKALEKLYEDVKAGIEAGKFARLDLLKVGYSLENTLYLINEIEAAKEEAKGALETLVGRKIEKLEPIDVERIYRELELSAEHLEERLLEKNGQIRAAKVQVKLRRKEEELSHSSYGAKITVDATLGRIYGFDSGKNEATASLSLNLSIPIFTAGRRGLELLEKRLLKRKALYEAKEKERELIRELIGAISKIKKAQSKIRAEKAKLLLAEEEERIEKLKYMSGKGDMNHLLSAQAKRYLSEAELRSSYYEWLIGVKELESLLEGEIE